MILFICYASQIYYYINIITITYTMYIFTQFHIDIDIVNP